MTNKSDQPSPVQTETVSNDSVSSMIQSGQGPVPTAGLWQVPNTKIFLDFTAFRGRLFYRAARVVLSRGLDMSRGFVKLYGGRTTPRNGRFHVALENGGKFHTWITIHTMRSITRQTTPLTYGVLMDAMIGLNVYFIDELDLNFYATHFDVLVAVGEEKLRAGQGVFEGLEIPSPPASPSSFLAGVS